MPGTCAKAGAAGVLGMLLVLTGCTTTTVTDASSTPAKRTERDLAEDHLVDVGIAIFSPGLAKNEKYLEKENIDAKVREAESAFLAYNLRNTLEQTENWGAVRIMPRPSKAIDLMVYGEIIESNGVELAIRIRAEDATGKQWLKKKYRDRASQLSYRDEFSDDEDAFQDIYNEVADDLLAIYEQMSEEDLRRIRMTAMLRFAEDISPYAFDDYLAEGRRGDREILRLPADDDPMISRVEKIREREYMFIDLLDEHYKSFHAQMAQPYADWRRYTYDELVALEDLRRAALATKLIGAATVVGGIAVSRNSDHREGQLAGRAAVLGGAAIVKAGFDMSSQSKIHAIALKELAESFRTEIEPMVVEVEGKTVTLSGTAEEQFDEWRRLLRQIYEAETGVDLTDGESEPVLPDVRFEH